MRRRVVAVLALGLVLAGTSPPPPAFAQQGTVRVQLASPTITIGESVRLAIVADGIDGELDASALEREFDVVGRSSSRDVQITNGARRSTVTWVLEIAPREVGVFTVPAVTVGGVESELVTLTVTEAPTGAARDIFVEAIVDTRTPWVQSQVSLTLRVFRAIDIVDGSLGEPSGNGLDVRAIGDDTRREEDRDGRRYAVVERRFALFPQRSGRLTIEPIVLTVTVPSDPARVRGFFSPTRRLTRRTAPIPLDVRPRPVASSGWWLPARSVTLGEGRGSGDAGGEARVGEPLTRTLRLAATGVLDAQLPDLETPSVDGLAIYADDPERTSEVGADGIESTLTLSLAIIPERAGTFELPPVTLDWFDVREGRTRTASLPARTLTVRPGDNAPASPAATPPAALGTDASGGLDGRTPSDEREPVTSAPDPLTDIAGDEREPGAERGGVPSRWRTLALAAFVGWALTGAALLVALRRRSAVPEGARGDAAIDAGRDGPVTVRAAREEVERRARGGDAAALGHAVLARAALRWPENPPRSLGALARRIGPASATTGTDDGLSRALAHLDATLYGNVRPDGAILEPATLPARLERALDANGRSPSAATDVDPEARALPPL